jgi:hypothetical protein
VFGFILMVSWLMIGGLFMQLTKYELPLMGGLDQRDDAARPGDALPLAWQEIGAALASIVGKRGSAAQRERRVQLHPACAEVESATLLRTMRALPAPEYSRFRRVETGDSLS